MKISRYYRSSNSKHCGSNWDFEFQHFSEIISILNLKENLSLSLKLQPKLGVIKMKITQGDRWPIFTPRNLNQLRSSWKLLYAIDDPYWLRVVQIHLKFEHFFEILSILVISKNYILCRWRRNFNQLRSSWKLLYAIDDPYWLRVVQIHLKFEHFFEILSILVISKKSVQYHCRWNLNQLRSSWKFLNAIDDPYLLRVELNTSNSDMSSQISL